MASTRCNLDQQQLAALLLHQTRNPRSLWLAVTLLACSPGTVPGGASGGTATHDSHSDMDSKAENSKSASDSRSGQGDSSGPSAETSTNDELDTNAQTDGTDSATADDTQGSGSANETADSTTESSTTDEDDSSEESTDEGDLPVPGEDQDIKLFEGEHMCFAGATNTRIVERDLELPPEHHTFAAITGHFALRCPNGRCDHWDRFGNLEVLINPDSEDRVVIELTRFITPYRVGFSWQEDLTALQPVLRGPVRIRAYIDTWVGPGNPEGDGWLLDARLEYRGGTPTPMPVAVTPLWKLNFFEYGNPNKPVEDRIPPRSLDLPPGTKSAKLRTFLTGHGMGNVHNCAEFCAKQHTLIVNGQSKNKRLWRDDCASTGAAGQLGTWTYSRAGWCPGARVHPWLVDIGDTLGKSEQLKVSYKPEAYVNGCRPDAPSCSGCLPGTTCTDGHYLPNVSISSAVVFYE